MNETDIKKLRAAANHLRLALQHLNDLTDAGTAALYEAEALHVVRGHDMPTHMAMGEYASMLVRLSLTANLANHVADQVNGAAACCAGATQRAGGAA